MPSTIDLAAFITAFSLLLYVVLSFKVGAARGKYGVHAPATTGNEAFERVYRVQMNTLEQLVFFLPSLWLFAMYVQLPLLQGILGAGWIIGRMIYAKAYYKAAEKRVAGFIISLTSASLLLIGGIYGVVRVLLG